MKKKRNIILMILALISVVVITVGITYAFFQYVKEGSTENSMTTGTITFLYTEVSGVGRGISISNAFPVSDEVGKAQVGEGNVFDFKVTSTTPRNASIPYEVTARMSSDSTLDQNAVKVYLTEVSGELETEILLDNYSNLTQTSVSIPENITEKTLYTDTVPANSSNHEKDFRLRMWISEDTDFSDGSMNGKTFTITVNVYANAEVVSSPVANTLSQIILANNRLITSEPTLTTSSNNSNDESGLYRSTATNTGKPTYYFRGDVENNYVYFAGFTWRIIRINEDGTVRLIMQDGINNNQDYQFNSNYLGYNNMYYTNSYSANGIMKILEDWYAANIANDLNYSDKIMTGDYYCEQAKVKWDESWTSGNADMLQYDKYNPTFKCEKDGNEKGIVNASVGLVTYDEMVFAGGYKGFKNDQYFLYNATSYWTMSPSGGINNYAGDWGMMEDGDFYSYGTSGLHSIRPVINLKADVMATGEGTSANPYIIQ